MKLISQPFSLLFDFHHNIHHIADLIFYKTFWAFYRCNALLADMVGYKSFNKNIQLNKNHQHYFEPPNYNQPTYIL